MLDEDVKRLMGYAEASDLSEVPDEPGIYAWFLPLRGDTSGDAVSFVRSLCLGLEKGLALSEAQAAVGSLDIVARRGIDDPRDAVLTRASDKLTSHQLQKVARLLLCCSFLSSPVYVGMTSKQGLRTRLQQHLAKPSTLSDGNWLRDFRSRAAAKTGLDTYLRQCVIAYACFREEELPAEAIRLAEHVLIRTARPAQSVAG